MADNLKLPLVDDNPMVPGMPQHALSSVARMTTASEAAAALLQSVDDTPTCSLATAACPEWTAASHSPGAP